MARLLSLIVVGLCHFMQLAPASGATMPCGRGSAQHSQLPAARGPAQPASRKLHQAGSETNNRSDRIAQALAASSEAIAEAASGRASVADATTRARSYARLATYSSSNPGVFARRLMREQSTSSVDDAITASEGELQESLIGDRLGAAAVRASAGKDDALVRLSAQAGPRGFASKGGH